MKLPASFVIILSSLVICAELLPAQPYITHSDVPAERGFRAVTLLRGLEHPWSMAWLPEGDILVTERPGRLRCVRNGRLASDAIADIPEVFASGQGGLLDVSLHPRFEKNRRVYFTYAHGNTLANHTRVASAVLNDGRLENWQAIFEGAAKKIGGQHFGSRLLWLPDETLLVSIGDGGNPPVRLQGDWIRKQAQNRRSHLGKILRFKDDGSLPPDNPFINSADTRPAIWSIGHRNIQGLAYDPMRSLVWASEHGALGGDELNLIQAGNNYGWMDEWMDG